MLPRQREMLSHESAGAVQAPLDGGERSSEVGGNLLQGHVRPVSEREDELELFRQRCHGLSNGLPLLPPFDRLPPALGLSHTLIQQRLVERHMVGGAGLSGAVADHLAPGDGVQPGGEAAGVPQAGQGAEGPHERLLADILRHWPGADEPEHRRQHGGPIPRNEAIEGSEVPHQALHYQLRVLVILPPLACHGFASLEMVSSVDGVDWLIAGPSIRSQLLRKGVDQGS
jgi:hypothetical protein